MQFKYVVVLVFCLLIVFGIYFALGLGGDDNIVVTEGSLKALQKLIDDNPIFIASKTTCPFCKQAYITLTHHLRVPKEKIKVLQLDEMKYGPELQKALFQMNGQRTVPHIYINGKFIGGNDKLQDLRNQGKLKALVEEALK